MLLITTTRIPHGYRLLATCSHQVNYYCWSLYRNQQLLKVISRSYHGDPCVTFDLREPLAPGSYELRVEAFSWPDQLATTVGQPEFTYLTALSTVLIIEEKADHCL